MRDVLDEWGNHHEVESHVTTSWKNDDATIYNNDESRGIS